MSALSTYVANIKTADGEYIELIFRVSCIGEARYLAKRCQIDGEVLAIFQRITHRTPVAA